MIRLINTTLFCVVGSRFQYSIGITLNTYNCLANYCRFMKHISSMHLHIVVAVAGININKHDTNNEKAAAATPNNKSINTTTVSTRSRLVQKDWLLRRL